MNRFHATDIAVIGLSCRLPGAPDYRAFWENLCAGVESLTRFSADALARSGVPSALYRQPDYVPVHGCLEDVEGFDAAFFGMTPREAELLDPQQRLFLECAWEALEDAGYADPQRERRIGVFGGVGSNTYLTRHLAGHRALAGDAGPAAIALGNEKDFLATRVSYRLNLSGPSMTLQTACSTSLVAVHQACQSLIEGACRLALAGAASIQLPQHAGYVYQPGGIHAPDGVCRALDARAGGTVGGSGCGMVVLKRLQDAWEDGDRVLAVIKGSAVNNDGRDKIGYAAPSVQGQSAVIAEALARAGLTPDSIGYIETHGTGTRLGDPIELAALRRVFGPRAAHAGPVRLGTLKPNIGHTDTAAGVAGLIKVVLALWHGKLPPSLHYASPNPDCRLEDGLFSVNTRLTDWPASPCRRAGVSAFGIGGTNAHLVLEQAPVREASHPRGGTFLLPVSARTPAALQENCVRLAQCLCARPQSVLADVSYSLRRGKPVFDYRRMVVADTPAEAAEALRRPPEACAPVDPRPARIVFMFPGQGAQWVGMARSLYAHETVFREALETCFQHYARHHGLDLMPVLFPEREDDAAAAQIAQTGYAQPVLFSVEYALARLWMGYGVQPDALIGHSLGEYVAACLAGVFRLEDALDLVFHRGALMQSTAPGAMLAVSAEAGRIGPQLPPEVALAAINHPGQCVVSGPQALIERMQAQWTQQGVACRRLGSAHAFHSPSMAPILDAFAAHVAATPRAAPALPWVSTVSGDWVRPEQAMSVAYWVEQVRGTVHFGAGIDTLLAQPETILIEVGPGRTLGGFARQSRHADRIRMQLSTLDRRAPDAQRDWMQQYGRLWQSGACRLSAIEDRDTGRCFVALPTYAFERQRHWVEAAAGAPTRWDTVNAALTVQARMQAAAEAGHEPERLAYAAATESLCLTAVHRALHAMGAWPEGGGGCTRADLLRQIGARSTYRQYLEHWLDRLVVHGLIRHRDGGVVSGTPPRDLARALAAARRRWPDCEQHWLTIERLADVLPGILRGDIEPRELLYPLSSGAAAPRPDRIRHQIEAYLNGLMTMAVGMAAQQAEAGRPLRVLEVGGGQGLTTRGLLPVLQACPVEYTFTDISRYFLRRARTAFGDGAPIDFAVFDLNAPPAQQGLVEQHYDLVIATLSLHVSRDLEQGVRHVRRLLAPGGMLVLWEMTQPDAGFAFVEGLVMPPLEDGERSSCQPFVRQDAWCAVLARGGFDAVVCHPMPGGFGHQVMLARADHAEPAPATTGGAQKAASGMPAEGSAWRDTELRLARLWARLLGVMPSTRHADFFELGGDSLLALQLLAMIRTEFGIELEHHALIQAPDLARLAARVEGAGHAAAPDPRLVLLKDGDPAQPPLFLVHAIGGHVYSYRHLAARLPASRRIYGLQALGGEAAPATMEAMASGYLEAVARAQPQGALHLAGLSFGGAVAFEMGRQALTAGRALGFLGMLDTPSTRLDEAPMASSADHDVLRHMLAMNHGVALPETMRETGEALLAACLDALRAHGVAQDAQMLRHELQQYLINSKAMLAYRPQTLAVPVHFYRARARDRFLPHHPERFWQAYAPSLHVIEVDGSHVSMLEPPHVEALARALDACLIGARA